VAQFWFGAINQALARKARAKPPGSLSAYEAYLLGIENILWQRADYETALEAFHRAVALDPAFGAAWAMIGVMKQWIADVSPPEARDGLLAEAYAAYRQAALYQPNDAMIQVLASNVALHDGDLDACRDAILRGVDLAPNLPDVLAAASWQALSCDVEGATAQGWAERAIALNPEGPPWHRIGLAQAALAAGDLDTAIRALSAAPPHHKRFVILAATRWNQGRIDAARRAAAELMMAFPDYSLSSDFGPGPHSRALAEVIDAAAMAGVPLTAPDAK
jgi:tetratricopeptide (TPR) repeat protein